MRALACAVCKLDKSEAMLAAFVLQAAIRTARDAYQQAGIQGLCYEGREEAALSAMQMLDLKQLLVEWEQQSVTS